MSELLLHNPEGRPPLYQPISLELGAGEIDEVMELYLDFLQLPEHERERIAFLDESYARTGESGYKYKDGNGVEDEKHLFHMAHGLMDKFNVFERTNLPMESRAFLEAADEIYHSVTASTKEFYRGLEAEEFPGLVGIHFPRNGVVRNKLRFLAYRGAKDGLLARGHYDKGTGTVAVAESHSGLRLGLGEHDLTLLDRDQYDPVFFHGYGWHQLAEMMDVETYRKAAWHDVVDTGESFDEDDGVLRWALIYFVDPAKVYLHSTKEQTHTPIDWRGHRAPQSLQPHSFLN